MLSPFVTCLTEQLEKRGFGEKRQAELVDRFQGLRENLAKQGHADPDTAAMMRVLEEVTQATADKQQKAYTMLLRRAELGEHFETYNYNNAIVGATNENANPGRAAIALLSYDARQKSGLNTETFAAVFKGELWSYMNDVLDKIGKGAFGIQRGKAHMDNIVREVHGQATGDVYAGQIAKAWLKVADASVDLWNSSGGIMRKLDGWALPQNQSMTALLKKGGKDGAQWIADHMGWLDWDKMHWPNGAPIKPEDRQRVLESVWRTLSSDGANKIEPNSFEGRGKSLGDVVDNHRFLMFKDGDAWLAMHEKYGDGNLFDVMAHYIDSMSHKMGLMRVFGPNVEDGIKMTEALALRRAHSIGGKVEQETRFTLKRFEQLTDQALRKNPMNPESHLAYSVNTASNLLVAAQLPGAVLAAIPGDFATAIAMRAANHMPVMDGLVGPMLRGLVSHGEAAKLSAEAGFIMDGVISTTIASTRFTGGAQFGPAWSRRVSDVTMRASGMNVVTDTARWANQQHFLGMFARNAEMAFDELPWKAMAERYGITADMWDRFRKLDVYNPRDGVDQLLPIHLLKSDAGAARSTYEAFQSMILQESRAMTMDVSPEANVMLKGNLRPDTAVGALLHSFAMYKNFPIGLALTYGRVAMAMPERSGRMAFVAGLGTSLVLAGAVGIQLRELSKGRDALPMNTPAFWGKSLLASGAMSVWGDFLFHGINQQGGPADTAAGPIVGLVGDTMQLAMGDMFDFADKVGSLKADKNSKTPWSAKAVEYASRYTPGTSLWYARTALQREIFDPMRMLADPRGGAKMDRKERQRVKDFGNDAWWPPGHTFPERAPRLIGGQ